ncbi:hypothetical protein BH09SUM1_BH09SUM1_06830 [soil metagenome]
MPAIHVTLKIDSETLELPELNQFRGKVVDIFVRDATSEDLLVPPRIVMDERELEKLREEIAENFDFEAYKESRKKSVL